MPAETHVEQGPLGREQIHQLLRERTGGTFPPPTLARIDRVAAELFQFSQVERRMRHRVAAGAQCAHRCDRSVAHLAQ